MFPAIRSSSSERSSSLFRRSTRQGRVDLLEFLIHQGQLLFPFPQFFFRRHPLDHMAQAFGNLIQEVPLFLKKRPFVSLGRRFKIGHVHPADGLSPDFDGLGLDPGRLPESSLEVTVKASRTIRAQAMGGYRQARGGHRPHLEGSRGLKSPPFRRTWRCCRGSPVL